MIFRALGLSAELSMPFFCDLLWVLSVVPRLQLFKALGVASWPCGSLIIIPQSPQSYGIYTQNTTLLVKSATIVSMLHTLSATPKQSFDLTHSYPHPHCIRELGYMAPNNIGMCCIVGGRWRVSVAYHTSLGWATAPHCNFSKAKP